MSTPDVYAGATIAAGSLTALAVYYRTEVAARIRAWRERHPARVDVAVETVLGPAPVDHAPCKQPDCRRDVCYCTQPAPSCAAASEALCEHGDMVCEDHRLECTDCLIDYVTDSDYDPEVA